MPLNPNTTKANLETRRKALSQELATVEKRIKQTELIQVRLERRIQVLEQGQSRAA
jgi:hypothetical protein